MWQKTSIKSILKTADGKVPDLHFANTCSQSRTTTISIQGVQRPYPLGRLNNISETTHILTIAKDTCNKTEVERAPV